MSCSLLFHVSQQFHHLVVDGDCAIQLDDHQTKSFPPVVVAAVVVLVVAAEPVAAAAVVVVAAAVASCSVSWREYLPTVEQV